jgi:hypothetical protein
MSTTSEPPTPLELMALKVDERLRASGRAVRPRAALCVTLEGRTLVHQRRSERVTLNGWSSSGSTTSTKRVV